MTEIVTLAAGCDRALKSVRAEMCARFCVASRGLFF